MNIENLRFFKIMRKRVKLHELEKNDKEQKQQEYKAVVLALC